MTEPLTLAEVAELREVESKMTTGHWDFDLQYIEDGADAPYAVWAWYDDKPIDEDAEALLSHAVHTHGSPGEQWRVIYHGFKRQADAEGVAKLRNAFPRLLDLVERLQRPCPNPCCQSLQDTWDNEEDAVYDREPNPPQIVKGRVVSVEQRPPMYLPEPDPDDLALKEQLEQQAARLAKWESALRLIKGALSPSPCPATTCEGCRIDWETAFDAACEALEDGKPTEVGE